MIMVNQIINQPKLIILVIQLMINPHDYHQFLGTPGREGNWENHGFPPCIATIYPIYCERLKLSNQHQSTITYSYIRSLYNYI